jgi:hypothetical protein
MHEHDLQWRALVLAIVVYLTCIPFVGASDEPNLNKDQIKQFLLAAKVVSSRHTSKGITSPWRLTLSDGTLTHDARFQTIDEHKTEMKSSSGRTELNFVDSYKYDIAAYALAELLGLDDMLPVTVERKWHGYSGSLRLVVTRDDGRTGAPQAEDGSAKPEGSSTLRPAVVGEGEGTRWERTGAKDQGLSE